MDLRLHYKQHIARAATKGLEAAMELKRLKGMAPSTTRLLFTAMVAPVVDYTSNVWMHACRIVPAYAIQELPKDTMEVIQSFALAPWEARLQVTLNSQEEKEENKIKELARAGWAVRIATSSSARNDLVGMGVAIRIPISVARAGKISETFSVTLGTREEHNPYTAELAAIAHGLNYLPEMKYRVIVIATSNKSAAQAI
ncbi:hypothetical protein FMUND_13505, partial [Fusarium mundagurra]